MLFSMIISLYTSRVILNTLGVEDYGIYNVVGGIVIMFGFLNNAMTASTQRFLNFEMGKKNYTRLNKVFNQSIIIHSLIAVVVLLLSETIGLWFLNTQLNIPSHRMDAVNWIYQFSVFSFIVSILYVPFTATIIAHEKMNVYALISIIEVLLKLFIVFVLTWIAFDKLKLYGFLIFLVYIIVATIYIIYCKRKFDECKFRLSWDVQLFKEMVGFANWNLVGVFAGIAYNQGVNILLNIFFGPVVNASRGIAYQVQGAVNSLVTNFQLAVNPQIVKSFAMKNQEYLYSLVCRSSKFSFFLLFIISLPLLIEAQFVLRLWLKIVPDHAVIFTKLTLIDVLICTLSYSLQTFVQASGNIKKYQIIVSGILLLNLPISYLLLKIGFNPEITFVVSILCSLSALFARLLVIRQIAIFPVKDFVLSILFRVFLVVCLSLVFPLSVYYVVNPPIKQFVMVTPASIISVLFFIWLIGLTSSEKEYVKVFINKCSGKIAQKF